MTDVQSGAEVGQHHRLRPRTALLFGDMTYSCQANVLWSEPVVEVLIRVENFADGWTVWIRHRHADGSFGACAAESYGQLSLSELQDVLVASSDSWWTLDSAHPATDPYSR